MKRFDQPLLIDKLDEMVSELETYRQKVNGLEEIVEKYREDEVTSDGVYLAKQEVAETEAEVVGEFDEFDIMNHVSAAGSADSEALNKVIEQHFGGIVDNMYDELEELEDRRQEVFSKSREYLSENQYL